LLQDSYYFMVRCANREGGQETYQSTQVIPDLGNIRVQPNCPRIGVECVTILVDLVIEHTNGAPERGIPAVTVNGLLVGLISLRILLL
jgi:hypothetical protein